MLDIPTLDCPLPLLQSFNACMSDAEAEAAMSANMRQRMRQDSPFEIPQASD